MAFSKEEAIRLASRFVGPEHILLGMMKEKENPLKDIFLHLNVEQMQVKNHIEEKIKIEDMTLPFSSSVPVLNDKANNVLKLAVLEARLQHTQVVNVEHVLLAILHDQAKNGAQRILESHNISYQQVLKFLRHENTTKNGIGLSEEEDTEAVAGSKSSQQSTTTQSPKQKSGTPVLDNFSTDLTKAALEGKLDAVVGREKEIQRVIEILCRRKKNNPVLIGEPGVGKSAIAEGLAQMIAERHTSPVLFNKRIVSLDMTSIVAGTKYRGQFEERIQALLKEIETNPNIIVFIDEIHTLIGAGSAPGTMDAANIMKPALARGVIQCIGATTLDEYRKSIEKDGALERRFQKVMVEPTTREQTLTILQNIKERYEDHHHVTYTDEALEACVRLTERYITDRSFPDKAIDALDEVGAKVHLRHMEVPPAISEKEQEIKEVETQKISAVKNQDFEKAAALRDQQMQLEQQLQKLNEEWTKSDNGKRESVSDTDVANVVSMMSGIPVQKLTEAEETTLRNMGSTLREAVVAQDDAIDKVVKSIQRNRVGLKDPNRPIGVFMFLGPTGVGKTYLAQKLAELMFGTKDAIIRIDMSEYNESFNTSRLVGAPPGYVGYEEGGQLTEKVRRHPYSIVLLDEIEKAHGNVFNILLQVFDEGRMTDGNGRMVDFRNTIIIMTSNAGSKQLKDFGRTVGFQSSQQSASANREHARSIVQKSLEKQFAPEFLNRLDEIITFDQLDQKAVRRITDIELGKLFQRIQGLGYAVQMSEEAKNFVASKSYDVQFGARPLKRAIQRYVEDGICERILSGQIAKQQTIVVGKNPEKEELTFE